MSEITLPRRVWVVLEDGSKIRIPKEIVDRSNMIQTMCRDVQCVDELEIPLNLSRQEASSSLIIRDFLDADYIEEAVRLLKRISVDKTPLLDREVNIIYNNPELLALAVYYSVISPTFYLPINRASANRLKHEYAWSHISQIDLQTLMAIASDLPPPNEIGSRIIDLLAIGFPPEMFDNIVSHMINIDDEFPSLELVKLGVRPDLTSIIEAVEEAVLKGEESDITWIVGIVLDEYNSQSIFLLYNIAFQYDTTVFIDQLPSYFSIDVNYPIELPEFISDRSKITRQLVDHQVDPAYLAYLITQSFNHGDVGLYQELIQLEVDIGVNYLLGSNSFVLVERLVDVGGGSVRLYVDISESDDETLLQILDDHDMLIWMIGNTDLASCVNLFDLLYVHLHPHWILMMELLPEYSPYLCYMLNSADREDMGCDENKLVPGISLLEAIEQGDSEALELNISILQDDDIVVEMSLNRIIDNPALEVIMAYRKYGLVAEGLRIQLTDYDVKQFLSYEYRVQLLTYLTEESIDSLMEIQSTRQLIESLYSIRLDDRE